MGHREQLFLDVAVVQTVGEVEGSVSPGRQEVGVCSFPQEEFDQSEVLLVHGKMQRAAAVVLLLCNKDVVLKPKHSPRRPTFCVWMNLLTLALMSAPRSTIFSTSERKP